MSLVTAVSRGRVLHMDAVDMLSKQPDNSAGAIIMDPPFFVSIGRAWGWKEKRGVGVDPWTKDAVSSIDEMIEWSIPLAREVARVLRPGGASVVMGSSQSIAAWEVAVSRAELRWMAELMVLWNTGKPRVRNFGSLITAIRWHTKPGSRHVFNGHKSIYSNVLVCDKVPIKDRLHVAQKPVELTNFLVSLLTNRGDLVIDPFCGSGSTLVSAAMCERNYLGGDIDIENCRIAETRAKRWELEEANLKPLYLWHNGILDEVAG